MEQVIAFALGLVASRLQGDWFKSLNVSETTRIRLRYAISLILSLGAGLATTYGAFLVNGEFSYELLLANLGSSFIASQTYYNTYFRLKDK